MFMKNCHKWMVVCVVGAIGIAFVLPQLGVPLAGSSLIVILLMIGCCVLPMLFMMKTGQGEGKGSCCSKGEQKSDQKGKEVGKDTKDSSASCH
jgi:hypothetical protein